MSSALWSPVRKTEISTVGSASKRANWSVSAKPSTTVATSPELETRPVGAREQDETFVFVAAVRLTDRAEEDLAARAAHRAAWQIERRAAHGVGHVVEGGPWRRSAVSDTSMEIS